MEIAEFIVQIERGDSIMLRELMDFYINVFSDENNTKILKNAFKKNVDK